MENVEYWFNLETGEVEVGKQTLASNRLGPFATESEAANAIQIINDRAAALRRADEEEDDWT